MLKVQREKRKAMILKRQEERLEWVKKHEKVSRRKTVKKPVKKEEKSK